MTKNHFNSCCTVYDKIQPTICKRFFCKPLKAYRDERLEWDKVKNLVLNLKKLRDEIESIFANQDLNNKTTLKENLDKIEKIIQVNNKQKLKENAILILKYIQFRNLKKEFYKPKD